MLVQALMLAVVGLHGQSESAQVTAIGPTYGHAYSHSHAVNGRLWVGMPIIGGADAGRADGRAHAAAGYGALDQQGERIVVQVEGLFKFEDTALAEISPWSPVVIAERRANPYSNSYTRVHEKMASRIEEARQQWLKDNNFVGGVRTHVNDATLHTAAKVHTDQGGLPEPRATIQLSPDVPRFRSRMRVEAPVGEARPRALTKVLPRTDAGATAAATKAATPAEKPAAKVAAK